VLARALVFLPPHTYSALPGLYDEAGRSEGHLARLTIRTGSLTFEHSGPDYTKLLQAVLTLPVIELS
jgi:hypothetical protein